ncbi:MAG TPA: glycosyltransferase family 4 protein [Candidatus Fournierella merdavium]|nr:glycosyltransferase family 4 protein [Candidatus Fournierella merdavium]
MKSVTVNALQFKKNSSGIGVMIRELFSRYTLITSRHCRVILPKDGPDFPASPDTEIVRIPWTYGQGIRRILFQTLTMGRRYGKDAILLTTDSKAPLLVDRSCTLVPLVTDLAVFRMPQVYKASRALWWKLQYRYLCRRADFFLAISEFTKSEMTQLLGIPPERIRVVPCAGPDSLAPVEDPEQLRRLREKYGLPEKYLLFVGNANPRKNLARMIRAFDSAADRLAADCRLVIAGEQGWKFSEEDALREIRHRERIHFIGFVEDGDMPALYSAAELFLFPTLYEGFGIPVIEAQMCGTPVLTSNCSSLPEVAGDAAVYVDPYSEESITDGLLRALGDPRLAADLRRKGLENARRFSWQKSAELLEKIISEEVKQ